MVIDSLHDSDLGLSPFDIFKKWHQKAKETNHDPLFDVDSMFLATASSCGQVTGRVVLFKGLREGGFSFFTNYFSKKGEQLKENPRASLTFYWYHLGQQVRIEGDVVKTTRVVSEKYFKSRHTGSQVSAIISPQSQLVRNREVLEKEWEKVKMKSNYKSLECPENWGGYLLKPNRIEFFQSRKHRLHDRIQYIFKDKHWEMERLAP